MGEPKSEASGRVIALDAATTDVLIKQKEHQANLRAAAGDASIENGSCSPPEPTSNRSRKLLGHSSIAITADTYTHVLPELARCLTEWRTGLRKRIVRRPYFDSKFNMPAQAGSLDRPRNDKALCAQYSGYRGGWQFFRIGCMLNACTGLGERFGKHDDVQGQHVFGAAS
ncbi:hypothetical protein [Amycolatopsis orientalis]|uniref:hypothetical protein n=1 Tax=Amycolatopsis orientalis TaxID=31958 RepID=UPI000A547966|nr:hypothetical protein [Amycolatopsis orientalis]